MCKNARHKALLARGSNYFNQYSLLRQVKQMPSVEAFQSVFEFGAGAVGVMDEVKTTLVTRLNQGDLGLRDSPNTHGTIATAGGQQPSIWRPGHAIHLASHIRNIDISRPHGDGCAAGGIPQPHRTITTARG